jgi:hypothetical protein
VDPKTKAMIFQEGGKLVGDFLRMLMSRPAPITKPVPFTPGPSNQAPEAPKITALAPAPLAAKTANQPPINNLPTKEETTKELKRRLARELYKAELDLAGGLRIAGKPCDCLDHKHSLFLEATSEELISQDPENPVYREIIQWFKNNQPKVTVEAIQSGQYAGEYPGMASQFKDFRKRVMGTAAFNVMETPERISPVDLAGVPGEGITLEQAKKLAAEEAAREVERQWQLVGK